MDGSEPFRHDPITLEILSNGLRSITDEAFAALMRSAYSTNIKERNDHSTAIFDRRGRLVVQARRSLPVHIGSMTGTILTVLEKYGDTIAEGDIFIGNDPHVARGSHLPDVNMAMPLFSHGQFIGFSANIAHHADIGGMAPGSMAGGMTEIYQEGLRIPACRLFKAGELQSDLFELLLLNVRGPRERRGDYNAQIAACRLGARRLHEILDAHGPAYVLSAFDEIIGRTEQRMRRAIETIPDGEYAFTDVLDDDGVGARDIAIRLIVRKSGGNAVFDFTGSAAQVPGNVNLTLNATVACVCFALKALLDPEVPNNDGVPAAIEVIAEPGSVVNAIYPAAVAQRSHACQRIVDVVLGALADCLPDRVVGAANGANTTAVFSGPDPRTGGSYVYLETLGGGLGGRAAKDGKDGVQAHVINTSNLPVEAIELEYPLMVEEYGLVEDSGGAGRFRGGLGLRRVIRPLGHACLFSGAGERFSHRPWGVFGGAPGATGRFALRDDAGGETALPPKPPGLRVEPDQAVLIETPGAGGYGPAAERDEGAVARDAQTGKFSPAYLDRHYRAAATRG